MKKKRIFWLVLAVFFSFLLDDVVYNIIQNIKTPFLDKIMTWFSNEISVVFILIVVSAIFLYQEHKKKDIPLLFSSFLLATVISFIIKLIIKRQRPEVEKFIEIGIGKIFFKIPDYSMPSTHSSAAFSVLPLLDSDFKGTRFFWIAFSVVVAISRIYLNQHYLSDVVLGSVLGYFIGYEIIKLEKKHVFTKIFAKNRD